MARFIMDAGNWQVKVYDPKTKEKLAFYSAVYPLSDSEWKQKHGSGQTAAGYIRVNGKPYAVGPAALRHVSTDKPRGAARYVTGYYDVLFAYALSELFQRSDTQITALLTHAPQDVQYAGKMCQIAGMPLTVECQHGILKYQTVRIFTADEPMGGLLHYALTDTGEERKSGSLKGNTLVIDGGGHTTDYVIVDETGVIAQMDSVRVGVLPVVKSFEKELRARYPDEFQTVHDIDPRKLSEALREGVFRFSKKLLDCRDIADECTSVLTNAVVGLIQNLGGAANFDQVLNTGGGGGLLKTYLERALPDLTFILAERNIEFIEFANAFGGAKMMELMKKQKAQGYVPETVAS